MTRLLLVAGCILLAGCGSDALNTPSGKSSAAPAFDPCKSAKAPGTLKAEEIALGDSDVSQSGITQQSSSTLGNQANTVQRVFASSDSSTAVELDLVVNDSLAQAQSEYPTFSLSGKDQLQTVNSKSNPGLGCKSDEFDGVDRNGIATTVVSLQEGQVIAVVIVESSGSFNSSLAVTLALTQDQKITAAESAPASA